MFNNVYRLVRPRQIVRTTTTIYLENDSRVTVRPLFLSICRADERYYSGSRDAKILAEKLPMSLVHEAMGVVVADPTATFEIGAPVVMIPTHAKEHDDEIGDNYLRNSRFASSSEDGFMREYVQIEPDRLITVPKNLKQEMASFIEVVSVALQAVRRLENTMTSHRQKIGVWGDGNVAYITSVILKEIFPEAQLYVFGKHEEKLGYFSFANVINIEELPANLSIDHAIEAVGGQGSESAINQIIDVISPRGTIVLSGVTEDLVDINTRMVLEKGLTLSGSSRSTRQDFEDAITIISKNEKARLRLELMIQNIKEIHNINDINAIFDEDMNMPWGKSIMKWEI
ncbi:zinc-binding dehydrogenase [Leuconostoc sp. C2]|uniref:zinc-binding dehydrogenase n=1 Tax=Leuconostoc sp. (strain C2) TaxID=979982 RepID=UPI0002175A10|nr:zinc-binding dehydrogenase [Leuconostoc sp. C2]AEJ30768.1 alcohol dehydrogenase [Leuconostoc sp. C2]